MTSRERPGATNVARLPSFASEGSVPPAKSNGTTSSAPEWESLFPTLAPSQQQALLALAAQQGLLHDRQLPASCPDRFREFLHRLFQGIDDALELAAASSADPLDIELDADQRNAVARALHTPDLAVIQGRAGTGKSRVIVEIIRQAVRRGQRILLTSRTGAGVDVVLERLAGDSAIIAIRGLGRHERIESLSPAAAARTVASYSRQFGAEALDRSGRKCEELQSRITSLQAQLENLDRLVHAIDRRAQACANQRALTARLERLTEEVQQPDDECGRRVIAARAACRAKLAQLEQDESAAAAEVHELQKKIAQLEADSANKRQVAATRGWLGKLFHFTARDAEKIDEWQRELVELRLAEGRAKQKADQTAQLRQAYAVQWPQEIQKDIDAEVASRRVDIERISTETNRQCSELAMEARSIAALLSPELALGESPSLEVVTRAHDQARDALVRAQQEHAVVCRWTSHLREHGAQMPMRLFESAHVAAAPMAALATDESIAELSRCRPFDLVIVDEADQIGENELISALRRGHRWVLLGEPPRHDANGRPERVRSNGRRSDSRAASVQAPLWPGLCQRLFAECWRREGNRIAAQFMPLDPTQRQQLEIESVADAPETELRIWSPAGASPRLAEVLFPASAPIESAVSYLYRELNELPVESRACSRREANDRVSFVFVNDTPSRAIELESGLALRIGEVGSAWQVASIEFDSTKGWDQPRIDSWLSRVVHESNASRAVRLRTNHRARPAVAALLHALGFESGPTLGAVASNGVEFIPVPALMNEPQARRRGDVGVNEQQRRLPPLRGGAGFEVDLADPKQRERLPIEFQNILPARGYVNLQEARAVIRLVENVLDDMAVTESERIQSVAILPLYAAQAILIRHLASRSTIVSQSPIPVVIESPEQFEQREADLVVIGLTRSHGHRAASYGDDANSFASAVKRAKRRLVLVGDPGTLARRTQWEGQLDRLDEASAQIEKQWVSQLVRILQGHGPAVVQLREGPP